MTRRSRRSAVAAVAAVLLAGACSPPDNIDAGLNSYSTDIVMGSQTKPTTPPPPAPVASLSPVFPSFIVSSPPPPAVLAPLATVPPTTTTAPPPVEKCPQASLFDIPDPAAPNISKKAPALGVYPYRQQGRFSVGLDVKEELPPESERVITAATVREDGTFSFDVAVTSFGSKTVTTYNVVKRSGQSDVDGLYITRTLMTHADGTTQEFAPVGLGLRILPFPAAIAKTWTSVATDAIRGSNMRLDGLVKEASRVDACGVVVEGWAAEVKIQVHQVGQLEPAEIAATYVIAPQLGGLIIGDSVTLTATRDGKRIKQETSSLINSIVPVGPPPS